MNKEDIDALAKLTVTVFLWYMGGYVFGYTLIILLNKIGLLMAKVRWIVCPICGAIVDEYEDKCSQCGYDKVWEDEDDEA